MLTSTPAKLLKLKGKGRLQTGMDADLLLMSSTNLKLKGVVAKGRVMKGDGWTAGGVFEKASSSIRPHVPMTGV